MDLLAGLNDAQRKAVLHGLEGSTGPLAVLAGPGTGKTRVITHRLAHLIVERSVDPASICALTFTIKAAEEMRTRLRDLLIACGPKWASKAALVHISTYHSLGRRILMRFADRAGLPRNLRLVDTADMRRLAREEIVRLGLMSLSIGQGADAAADIVLQQAKAMANSALSVKALETYIAESQDRLQSVPLAERSGRAAILERFRQTTEAVRAVQEAQRKRGWIGFDEFLTMPIELLRRDSLVREIMQGELRHAVVDEFQDVNAATIVMLSELFPGSRAGKELKPDLCVVGDDDQAIYGFRGADERAFDRFARLWPASKRIMLEENYRCATPIIAAAGRIIGHANRRANPDKVLRASPTRAGDKPGSGVRVVRIDDASESTEVTVAAVMTERAEDLAREPDARWDRYAVLARNNIDLERLQAAFELEGIPVQRKRTAGALDDEGVQDLIAWCRILIDPNDYASARRILMRPPIGLSPAEVSQVEPLYRAALRDARLRGSPHPGDYASFLIARGTGDARLQRFADTVSAFVHQSQTGRADQLIYDLAIRTGVVHADLLGPIARGDRLQCVVRFVQFARERQPTLEAPGSIVQFIELLSDFADADDLGVGAADRIDGESEQGEPSDKPDGVRLMTAHASKGLEFDTVFATRVVSPHGFPKLSGGNTDPVLPDELTVLPGETPAEAVLDASLARRDEERRIFYVACTRAIRRLVLIGNTPTGGSKKNPTVSYINELLAPPSIASTPIAGNQILSEAPLRSGILQRELQNARARTNRRELIAALASAERMRAADALALVERADVGKADLETAVANLRLSAERIAAIAHAGVSGGVPEWIDRDRVADLLTRLAAPEGVMHSSLRDLVKAPPPPLTLSYSSLNEYKTCPACYWCRRLAGLEEPADERQALGQVIHAAMQTFGEQTRLAEANGAPVPTLADLLDAGRRALGETDLSVPLVRETELVRRLTAQLTTAYSLITRQAEGANILLIEKSFTIPFYLPSTPELEHTVRVRLDRVEQRADGSFAIVDFKTGSAKAGHLEPKNDDLQMGLYAMALQQHLSIDTLPTGSAEYYLLSTGEIGRISFADLDLEKIRLTIRTIMEKMLAGEFPRSSKCTTGPCRVFGIG